MSTHKNFKEFKSVMIILMYFDENLSLTEINDFLQDWYVMYKSSKIPDPKEWGEFWFQEANRDKHAYHIDERGRMLLYLSSRIN